MALVSLNIFVIFDVEDFTDHLKLLLYVIVSLQSPKVAHAVLWIELGNYSDLCIANSSETFVVDDGAQGNSDVLLLYCVIFIVKIILGLEAIPEIGALPVFLTLILTDGERFKKGVLA